MLDNQLDALSHAGWFAQENFIPPALCQDLCVDLKMLQRQGSFQQAGIGRGPDHRPATHIRTDQTYWLDGRSPAQKALLQQMDELRLLINRTLFMGLHDYEAHYASYQAGGFYKKHLDSFKGRRNRILSTVLYLTPAWREEDEGHLVIYDAQDQDRELARVLPAQGTLACFLSEEIPHEVLPPRRERISIAGWFRVPGSDIINP
jgi:SM-20-related protein